MPTVNLPIQPGQLPSGVCPTDYQALLNLFAANMVAVATTQSGSSFNQWLFSASKPSDNTVGWFRLDALGRPVRPYLFAQGAWLSLHPTPPGATIWWFDAVPDFNTFDGGDSNVLGPITGNMWQAAKDLHGNTIAAKFPLVSGTLPSGTVLAVGDTGGTESNTLTSAQVPIGSHVHGIGLAMVGTGGPGSSLLHGTVPGPSVPEHPAFDTAANVKNEILSGTPLDATNPSGSSSATPTPVSHLPPYICGVLLQRSARLFYSVV